MWQLRSLIYLSSLYVCVLLAASGSLTLLNIAGICVLLQSGLVLWDTKMFSGNVCYCCGNDHIAFLRHKADSECLLCLLKGVGLVCLEISNSCSMGRRRWICNKKHHQSGIHLR